MIARLLRIALIVLALVAVGLAWLAARGWGALAGVAVFMAVMIVAPAVIPSAAYVLSAFGKRPEVRIATFIQRLAAALDEVAAFWLLYVIFQPFDALWMGAEERLPLAPDATPVLLIPGYCCNRAMWRSLRRELRQAGRLVATVTLDPPFAGIDLLAEALALRIDRLLADTGARQVVLVGHSMGGLVARAYLWRRGGEHVAKLITIATPHHGTWLARLGLGRNAREMVPGSGWLAALNSRAPGVPSACVWSAGDEIVQPPESARLAGASEAPLMLPGHFSLLRAPEVLRAVLQQEGVPAAAPSPATDEVHA